MRVFLGFSCPKEQEQICLDWMDQLKRAGVEARWIEPAMLHMTVAFLGEQSPEQIQKVIDTVDRFQKDDGFSRLDLKPEGLAKWGPALVMKFDEDPRLSAKVARLKADLKAESIAFDVKKFVAHITLARRLKVCKGLPELPMESSFEIHELVLFESILSSGPARYDPIKIWRF